MKVLVLTSWLLVFKVNAEIVVVVNQANSTISLSKSDLARFFMGKSTEFLPVNQVYSTNAYDEFCANFLGKNSDQMKAFWAKQMFMGKGTPPQAFGSDSEIVAFVAANVNSIGYVNSGSVSDGVKVITVE